VQLYLIRHAQSANNALPESQRVSDPSLTDLGHEQARKLAEWLPRLELTRLYTSPFLRTLETTAAVCEAVALTPEVRIHLHEQGGCYSGYWPNDKVGEPGMTRAEIEARFPHYRIEESLDGKGWWRRQPYETYELARQRAKGILAWADEAYAGSADRVAIIMHADIKSRILELLHEETLETPMNTSVTRIELIPGGAKLREYNQVEHLSAGMITS